MERAGGRGASDTGSEVEKLGAPVDSTTNEQTKAKFSPAYSRPAPSNLADHLIQFGRALRGRGFLVGPGEIQDGLRVLQHVDIGRKVEVYLGLRSVFTNSRDEYKDFDELFERFFGRSWLRGRVEPPVSGDQDDRRDLFTRHEQKRPIWDAVQAAEESDAAEEERQTAAYSPYEMLMQKDFATFTPDQLDEIGELIERLARRLAMSPSRRLKRAKRSRWIDARRSMRWALKYGGDPIILAHRRRKLRRNRIVLICDVSGSMDLYSRFLIQFAYALQSVLWQVETFVFSTRLTRITEYFRNEQEIRRALMQVSQDVADWSGGTKIGLSLKTFNEEYAPAMVDYRTTVIILSDGWDTGDADVMQEQMSMLQRRARRIIWMNPLLGSPHYEPRSRGMVAALPFIDLFVSAHSIQSLLDLEAMLLAGGV